jgi:RNA polymerase sigma factor (sigma-70 family)
LAGPVRNSRVWSASDEGLLAGVAAGDSDAAVAFVRRYQRRMYGLALTIVGEPALAEDLAQEAFVRVWRHAANYDSRRGSVATWILTITRNLCIDALRLRRADPVDPAALSALPLADQHMSPDDAASLGDEVARLRMAIGRLPTDQQRALVLAVIGGRTAKEISEAEQIPLGTAKTRIRSAMHRLRADLTLEPES